METTYSILRAKALTLFFTAAVVLGVAVAETAHASLIYTPDVNLTVTPVNGDSDYISFNVFSQQAAFDSVVAGETALIYYNNGNASDPIILFDNGNAVGSANNTSRLSAGTTIDSSLNYQFAPYLQANWSNAGEGYVGFEVWDGAQYDYGWARLNVVDGTSVTLLDFAVDDSGNPINAGQITAVPEPVNMALGFFGVLLGGGQSFRWWNACGAKLSRA